MVYLQSSHYFLPSLGTLRVNEMMDLSYNRIDTVLFKAMNIRNRGAMYLNNGLAQHLLRGDVLQVYPGGLLHTRNVKIEANKLMVDVLGTLEADAQGYCSNGRKNVID